jgi:hypothetical protein
VYPNDPDLTAKIKWLKDNDHKTYYWSQWLKVSEMKNIGKIRYNPDTEEISNWMIRKRSVKVDDNQLCFNPTAFCWSSGKRLFLKRATVVHTLITGPGDPLREKFYFDPKRYTLWLLNE